MRSQVGRFCLLSVIALTVAGCQTFQGHEKKVAVKPEVMSAFLADKPPSAHRLYRNVLEQGERNLVLNHMRAGLAAMDAGYLDAAEKSFDVAVERIEAIYADNANAEGARSNFTKENVKDFKGEGYERALAFYYRGLLYLMKGDYGNAQASFGSGLLQDTYAENEKYAQDFAALAFLRGWAYRCQGSETSATESFEEAASLRRRQSEQDHRPSRITPGALVAPGADHNVLLVGESGGAPRKMATGQYKEKLTYRRGVADAVTQVAFAAGATTTVAPAAEDVFWQAETRGGRPVDHIMDGKAAFKGTTDTVGNVMLATGAATAMYGSAYGNDNAAIAGGLMMLGGLIAKGISDATRPDADLRQWDNLPGYLHLATARLDPAIKQLNVSYLDSSGQTAGIASRTAPVTFAGSCGIAWSRAKSALDVPDDAPESGSPEYLIPEPTIEAASGSSEEAAP